MFLYIFDRRQKIFIFLWKFATSVTFMPIVLFIFCKAFLCNVQN